MSSRSEIDPVDGSQGGGRRRSNVRLALLLGAIALGFYLLMLFVVSPS